MRENKPNASGQCFLFCRKLGKANGVIFLGCVWSQPLITSLNWCWWMHKAGWGAGRRSRCILIKENRRGRWDACNPSLTSSPPFRLHPRRNELIHDWADLTQPEKWGSTGCRPELRPPPLFHWTSGASHPFNQGPYDWTKDDLQLLCFTVHRTSNSLINQVKWAETVGSFLTVVPGIKPRGTKRQRLSGSLLGQV